jgi:hypothetical protein
MTVEVIDMDTALSKPLMEPAPAALPAVQHTGTVAQLRTRDDMLFAALDRGFTPEQIEKMMDLRDRQDRFEAQKAYSEAMAAFKADPPVIVKDKAVGFDSRDGESRTEYMHATHFNVTQTIAAALAKHGLSHSWSSTQGDGKITVACTIKHRLGHSDSTSMTAPYDASGKKNAIQAIGSAKTYLERYTLLGITGLSTQDLPDDDGAGAGDESKAGPITEQILEGLLADLKLTTTDAAAAALWATGSKVLAASGRKEAYEEFKQHVLAHRRELKEAGRK